MIRHCFFLFHSFFSLSLSLALLSIFVYFFIFAFVYPLSFAFASVSISYHIISYLSIHLYLMVAFCIHLCLVCPVHLSHHKLFMCQCFVFTHRVASIRNLSCKHILTHTRQTICAIFSFTRFFHIFLALRINICINKVRTNE